MILNWKIEKCVKTIFDTYFNNKKYILKKNLYYYNTWNVVNSEKYFFAQSITNIINKPSADLLVLIVGIFVGIKNCKRVHKNLRKIFFF